MKKVLLLLLPLLLVACAQTPPETTSVSNVSNVSESSNAIQNETVPAPLVQCPDGVFVSSVADCEDHKVVEPVQDNKTIARTLLEEARGKFSSYAYVIDDAIIIQYGNKSRYYYLELATIDTVPVTDIYVDKEAKTAVAYCNIDRESRLSDASFDYERSKCKDYLDAPINLSFEQWNPKGPIDFLEQFENDTPVLMEDNLLTMSIGGNSKTIQPSLHYEKDGKDVILRIDKRYRVPAKVEIEGEKPIDFRDAYFDLMVIEGKQERITADWVSYQNVSAYWLKGNSK